jgi:putative tricarboxylic transport membrane protein
MRSERIQGIIWIGVAGVIAFLSLRLPLGDVRQAFDLPGPGFFPLALGVLLAILGTFLLLKPLVEGRKTGERQQEPETAEPIFWMNKRAFSVLVSLVVYSALFERLGFLFSTFLFLVLLFRGISSQKWTTSLIAAVGVSLLSYLIFDTWLMAQLPKGFLRF